MLVALKTFGATIKEARGSRSAYSIAALAVDEDGVAMSRSTLSEIERGVYVPTPTVIDRIAKALGIEAGPLHEVAEQDRLDRMRRKRGAGDWTKKPVTAADIAASMQGVTTGGSFAAGHRPKWPQPDRIEPLVGAPMRMVSVWRISCGEMIELDDGPDYWREVPVGLADEANAVMIVGGTSMLGCGFKPGDRLFVRMLDGDRPVPGDEVIAKVGDGYTCKVYRKDGLGPYLESAPGEGEAWRHPVGPDVQIVAEVVGVYSVRKRR